MDLFDYMRENAMEKESPLASRLRPRTLDEVVGQQHIIGKDKLLYRAIKADKLGSVISVSYTHLVSFQRVLSQVPSCFRGLLPDPGNRAVLLGTALYRYVKGRSKTPSGKRGQRAVKTDRRSLWCSCI